MKDFIYCLIWLIWLLLCDIVSIFDKKQLCDSHWTWKARPKRITKHIVKKYGCLMNAFKKYHLVWLYDII